MTSKIILRMLISTAACFAMAIGAQAALADTIHIEAESARDRSNSSITSPMLIKDDSKASGGSYIAVEDGYKSDPYEPDSTVEGVAKYDFRVGDTGTYRIWARVSAANNGDDSFWVRMGSNGSWIRFNGWELGVPYHWVLVAPDPPAPPSTFELTAGGFNQLQIAYREDGTRLDALIITDDTSLDPNAAPAGPPEPPLMQPAVTGTGVAKLSWSAVAGADVYLIERTGGSCDFNPETGCCEFEPFQPVGSVAGLHKFTDSSVADQGSYEYRVTAIGPTGSSSHPVPGPGNCFPDDPSRTNATVEPVRVRANSLEVSLTSPMQSFENGMGAPVGYEKLRSPPKHGRIRLDFELAQATNMRMWARIVAPNPDQDSFWVRWGDGAWIKWNNLDNECETLYNSSKSGQPIVTTYLPAGSYRFEVAYREGGARINDTIVLVEDSPNQTPQCD